MNLRLRAYVAPKHPRGLKDAKWPFPPKSALLSKNKSGTKFLSVKNISKKVVRHALAYLAMQKQLVGDISLYVKIWPKLTHPFKNADSSSCVFFLSRKLMSQGVLNCPILCSSFQFTVISQFCPILEIIRLIKFCLLTGDTSRNTCSG